LTKEGDARKGTGWIEKKKKKGGETRGKRVSQYKEPDHLSKNKRIKGWKRKR